MPGCEFSPCLWVTVVSCLAACHDEETKFDCCRLRGSLWNIMKPVCLKRQNKGLNAMR